jgi:plasmid stability protein
MAQLVLSNIEDEIVGQLRKRADEQGVSIEEVHRQILRDTLLPTKETKRNFIDHLLAIPAVGPDETDDLFARDRRPGREIEL